MRSKGEIFLVNFASAGGIQVCVFQANNTGLCSLKKSTLSSSVPPALEITTLWAKDRVLIWGHV